MKAQLNIKEDLWFMQLAIEQAHLAFSEAEVPVGACLVSSSGKVISKEYNKRENENNPIGHAELLCLQKSSSESSWRLNDCTLYVTLEPCLMCMGAIVQSRVSRLVFGAYDNKGGALSLGYNFQRDNRLNHQFNILGGLKHFECSSLLSKFFRQMRANKK